MRRKSWAEKVPRPADFPLSTNRSASASAVIRSGLISPHHSQR
ncbi:MAG TPA: hypothetical protein V6D13_10005 [Halomicronema sp.]